MDSKPLLSNGLKTQSVAVSNKCTIKSSVNEDVDGCKLDSSPSNPEENF